MRRSKSTSFVDPDMGKPWWFMRGTIRAIRTFLRIRYGGAPPVVYAGKHGRQPGPVRPTKMEEEHAVRRK